MTTICLHEMSDRQLLAALMEAANNERRATAALLELLGEVEARRLYLSEGCSSPFAYCTEVLGFSEHEAYLRIEAARAARRFPVLLERLANGALSLTTAAKLARHLTDENVDAQLAAAAHKTKREVEHQIACLATKPDARSLIRKLPASVEAEPSLLDRPQPVAAMTDGGAPAPRPQLVSLSADRYLLRITLSADGQANLRQAQGLLRHRMPNGDPAAVVERALSVLVEQLEKQKVAKTTRPRAAMAARLLAGTAAKSSRYIPAEVRREVWVRDEGRCAFVGRQGRCTETGRLEFHHTEAFARGGPATVANLALRCRAHNQFESDQLFGPWIGK